MKSEAPLADPVEAPAVVAPSQLQQTMKRLGPPAIYGGAVVRLLRDAGEEAGPIVAAIETCPAMSARLIGLISSAAFGEPWRCCSVPRAVQLLGPRRSKAIALAYALRSATRPAGLPPTTLDTYRFAALHKAWVARLFCLHVAPQHADAAYALALVQDLGLPMLMATDPDYYDTTVVPAGTEGWMERERHRFGLTHATVAQELLLSWQAGDKVQQLVLAHHKLPPEDAASDDAPLLHALYLASLLPHLGETMDLTSNLWVEEVFGQFLGAGYDSPDTFLLAAITEVRNVLRDAQRVALDHPSVLNKLVAAVTSETISNTARLAKAEQAYEGQRQSFANLREQAYTDPLTRLLNRRGFLELAERRMRPESCGRGVCCLSFDLDGLKKINDTHGHETGDQLLRGFAKLLRRYFDEDDLIARFGGDEYAAVIADVDEPTARKVAQRISGQLHRSRLRLRPDVEVDVSCSIGAVFYAPAAGPADIEAVLSQADHVMYRRKHDGKAGLLFEPYTPAHSLDPGDSGVGRAAPLVVPAAPHPDASA